MNLTVWMYWEGKVPEWVQACQRTVSVHVDDVQLLNPGDFDRLWNSDRDIELTRLYVAHRADYIRAFLLAKYGGLWIDSDCIVLKNLQPLLNSLERYDFIGYKNLEGLVANNFMGARPTSKIATTYYRRVCHILRSHQPRSWLTLGSHALSDVIQRLAVPWLCLETELIQPVNWSNPGDFFIRRGPKGHERILNRRAYCYMISRHMVQGWQKNHPNSNLMADETFFTFLLRKALRNSKE